MSLYVQVSYMLDDFYMDLDFVIHHVVHKSMDLQFSLTIHLNVFLIVDVHFLMIVFQLNFVILKDHVLYHIIPIQDDYNICRDFYTMEVVYLIMKNLIFPVQ